MNCITTSWDDGHELDFKIAELLYKYNLPASFYIPRANAERSVMSEKKLQELSGFFDIGGHGLSHIRLKKISKTLLQQEVRGSFEWLRNITGHEPVSFCFPGGVYDTKALMAVFDAGYKIVRTAELLSIKISKQNYIPTTLQLYQHTANTYFFHLLKRKKISSLITWLHSGCETDLQKMTEYYLKETEKNGGCFHLWGHSWEIEEFGLWGKLESVFKILSKARHFEFLENRELTMLQQKKPMKIYSPI